MHMAKVMLVDDDPFIRAALEAAITSFGLKIVGSAGNVGSAIECLKTNEVDVAIVDLDLGPGPSGVDICVALRNLSPKIGLILLTSYLDPRIHDPRNRILPKGCRFISKSEIKEMKSLISEILIAKNKPLDQIKHRNQMNTGLTDTQLEVLKAVANGLSTHEIAKTRQVSEKAIEGILSKTYSTLGLEKSQSLNQRVQLTRVYFKLTGKRPPGE